jgi:hypothetical protein
MLVFVKLAADFSRGCVQPVIAHAFLLTHPHRRLLIRELPPASLSNDERDRRHTICPVRSIRYMRLGQKLIDVVVVAVVYAVDVGKPAVPACPLTVAYPPLGEARHPTTIEIQTIAEVEVLYLYLMLTRYDGSNDVLMLTNGGKGGIVLDPAQHVRYTGCVHK